MSRPENKVGMPLHIWGWVFMIALTLLLSLYFIFAIRDKQIKKQGVYFKEFANTTNEKLDAYFIGTSLTDCALFEYHSLDSEIRKRNIKINYKATVLRGASLRDFNVKIKELRELRPRYLFIESNIVCIDLGMNAFYIFRKRLVRIPLYFISMKRNAFKLINNYAPISFDNQYKLNLGFETKGENTSENYGDKFRVRKIDEFRMWDSFYREAAGLGIKIYLLDMPRSAEAEQGLSAKFKQQYAELVKQFIDVKNIKHVEFKDKISKDEYYQDYAHFNKKGSYYYCDWLLDELCKQNLLNRN